jgi:hypothetical protein
LGNDRPKKAMNDFERGYCYAQWRNETLAEKNSVKELLELAEVFAEVTGENAELAKGMAAYYAEMARRVMRINS